MTASMQPGSETVLVQPSIFVQGVRPVTSRDDATRVIGLRMCLKLLGVSYECGVKRRAAAAISMTHLL